MPGNHPEQNEENRRLLRLKEHDFQIAFLALLTLKGIKPAGRWEKPLPGGAADDLRRLGLSVRRVKRTTRNGTEVTETLFSLDPKRLEKYASRFDGRPIDKGVETVLFEGGFFGYPACCVEEFARNPYAPNSLAREDQAMLYHWACPGCSRTPSLIEKYRTLRDYLTRL